ncbi:MAG: glycosyltransferase family 39 protein [Anaerolineales bacterium]|nr:glycosyltransferase family 39 protein [Anaerolineales bacterium]
MVQSELSVWDWLIRKWKTPRWKRAVRLLLAALLAAAGAAYLATMPSSANWLPLFALALVLIILGLRIEVPDEPLPVEPDGFEPAVAQAAAPEPEQPPAAAPGGLGLLALLRIPFALILALSAQWVMDVRPMAMESTQTVGWILYVAAFLLFASALLAGDAVYSMESPPGIGRGIRFSRQRLWLLVGGIFFGVLAYAGSAGGMFQPLALLTLAFAIAYWWAALADYQGNFIEAIAEAGRAAGARIRALGLALRRGVTFSWWSLLVVTSFCVLVFTRTVDLANTPPEMTSDHVEKLINVAQILEGENYIFFANNGGRESLQFYLVAFVSQVFGTGISFLSLKIVSVAVGILTLPFLYLLGREIADRRIGLLAMILGGVGYWPDMISRIGLRLPMAMLFCAATLYFFYRALRRRSWNDFLRAGLALGIGLYGYTPIRVVPVALAVILVLFLINPVSKGSRKWAAAGFLVTMGTMTLLFVPFLRYAVEFPADFWLRTTTRIFPGETFSVVELGKTFLNNVWIALQMFSWNDGVGWFNCVPLRPALDVITGGLFHLGLIGMLVWGIKKKSWEALSLFLLLPILLLPTILALAIPNENPSLARAIAAVPVVYLLPALTLVLAVDFLRGMIPGRSGVRAGAIFASILVVAGAVQDFDLTRRQYPDTYRINSENASELGVFMRQFVASIGTPEDVYLIPYPYWVDDRIMNIAAGFPIDSQHYLFPDQIAGFEFSGRPTLFLLLAEDADSLEALKQKFPNGYYATVVSSYPNHDFMYFIVPGIPGAVNP